MMWGGGIEGDERRQVGGMGGRGGKLWAFTANSIFALLSFGYTLTSLALGGKGARGK